MIHLLLGFLIGVVVGIAFREAYELARGRDSPVALLNRLRNVPPSFLAIGLILSMIFTGVVGITVAVSTKDQSDLVSCVSKYNEESGKARDSRIASTDKAAKAELEYLDAEIQYQNRLIRAAESGEAAGLPELLRTRAKVTREYRDQLANSGAFKDQTPYPEPDLCEVAR